MILGGECPFFYTFHFFMRFYLIGIVVFFCAQLNAQAYHPVFETDTLKIGYRIGGKIDSVDYNSGNLSSSVPGGLYDLKTPIINPLFIFQFPGGQRFYGLNPFEKIRFCGLPHLGFSYVFGTNGFQAIRAEYQQAFHHNFLLNIDYNNAKSNGVARSSAFAHHHLSLQLVRLGVHYSFELQGMLETSNVHQYGGIKNDSLIDHYPLDFLPVTKPNAQSHTKRVRIIQSNYFDFLKDSTRALGLVTTHELTIKKFSYSESDSINGLSSLYPIINYDSSVTADQHQWSQFSNGIGFFTHSKNSKLKAGVNAKFWNFQNLGRYYDTLELNLVGNYQYATKHFYLDNQTDLNLVGAKNEFSNYFRLNQSGKKYIADFHVNYENKLPDYYQRYAYGNTYNANPSTIEKQQRFNAGVSYVRSLGKTTLTGSYSYTDAKNNYFFSVDRWRNDVVKHLNFHQFSLSVNWHYKILSIQPVYQLTLNTKAYELIPQHALLARVFLKKQVFKSRKMEAILGMDASIYSAYQRLGYVSSVSAFDVTTTSVLSSGYSNLHLFGGFQLDEFRFFVRAENLGYYWMKPQVKVLNGYPIIPLQLKVGITWDFFN
jgi:hypothetical protein